MSDLNKKQFEAVETVNGPVVIIAGPGTGKTKTLVERTVNILVNKKVEAKKIMITTFTNKAAKELELRINERLEELNENDTDKFKKVLREEANLSNLGTILKFLTKILYEKYNKYEVLFLNYIIFRNLFQYYSDNL